MTVKNNSNKIFVLCIYKGIDKNSDLWEFIPMN